MNPSNRIAILRALLAGIASHSFAERALGRLPRNPQSEAANDQFLPQAVFKARMRPLNEKAVILTAMVESQLSA
jgi:hypothetical protein